MIAFSSQVNLPVRVFFKDTPGKTSFGDLVVVKDGNPVPNPSVSYTEVSAGFYRLNYTPTSTGIYTFHVASQIPAQVEVVTKTIYSYLRNIEDEAMGSWQWDKTSGVLTMVRQDGSELAKFNIVDNLTTSSRELV